MIDNLLTQPLFLCGMMGSGKSTIGKALAQKLSVPFHDLDHLIEEKNGMSIPEIFKKEGKIFLLKKKVLIMIEKISEYIINPLILVGLSSTIIYFFLKFQLEKQRAYFQELFSESPNSIVLLDNRDRVLNINKGFENLFEYRLENIKGKKINDLIVPENNLNEAQKKSSRVIEGEKILAETIRKTKNGEKIYVEINAFPIKIDSGQIGIFSIYQDIRKRKQEEEKIKYLSFHDELSALYNRRYFENEIKRINNSRYLPISIIIGDIDNLKYINDNYGHKIGDEYIKKAAEVFKLVCREGDIISRIGGDEFAILLAETPGRVAEKICICCKNVCLQTTKTASLPEPLQISLGSATMNLKNENLNDIFNKADQKMYKNKYEYR